MDTAPAAVLGALDDPVVAAQPAPIVVNVGNFHTLAFQFAGGHFVRLFEHHTGELTRAELAGWLRALADGVDPARGRLCRQRPRRAGARRRAAAAGACRRGRTAARRSCATPGCRSYFAVPHGDQMLAGCFGLLRACADLEPDWREPISAALAGALGPQSVVK